MRCCVEKALGLLHNHALRDGDEPVLGHQLRHPLVRIGGEAHVAIGEDADEPALAPAVAAGLDHGDAGDLMVGHQLQRVGEAGLGMDGHRVHHHARLELLHLGDLGGLHLGIEIAVDHADAARLRHGNGELGLGDRVHGRGDDRDMQRDRAGEARGNIGLVRQHIGGRGPDQDVVEGERNGAVGKLLLVIRGLPFGHRPTSRSRAALSVCAATRGLRLAASFSSLWRVWEGGRARSLNFLRRRRRGGGGEQPAEQISGGERAEKLGHDEARRVARGNSRKRVAQAAGDGHGRIGERGG